MKENTYTYNNVSIHHLGHASIMLEYGDLTIYFDPFANPDKYYDKKANIVLISHEHFDHCSPDVLKRICDETTTIIAHQNCKEKLEEIKGEKHYLKPGEKTEVEGIKIESVHAYNINKPYHPKGSGNGYLVEINNTRFYHPGDTDRIEEMKSLKDKVDVFFVPISGTYVMDVDEAVEAVKDIMPKIVIPMHYNYLEGLEKDPNIFKEKVSKEVSNVKVVVIY